MASKIDESKLKTAIKDELKEGDVDKLVRWCRGDFRLGDQPVGNQCFYMLTYPEYRDLGSAVLQDCATGTVTDEVVERRNELIHAVFSWIPRHSKPGNPDQTDFAPLWTKVAELLADLDSETISAPCSQNVLEGLLRIAHRILNTSSSVRVSSSSKLLHFMCPERLPILDAKVYGEIKTMKASTNLAMKDFVDYTMALGKLLEDPKFAAKLEPHAREASVSLIRMIDVLLFNKANRSK